MNISLSLTFPPGCWKNIHHSCTSHNQLLSLNQWIPSHSDYHNVLNFNCTVPNHYAAMEHCYHKQYTGLEAWNSIAVLLIRSLTHQQALQLQHDSLSEVWKKKDLEACPLLSVSISVQVPLETQELLDMAFVGHSSLSLPSTSLLLDSSLKW